MNKEGVDISNELASLLNDDELKTAAKRLERNREKKKPQALRVIENASGQESSSAQENALKSEESVSNERTIEGSKTGSDKLLTGDPNPKRARRAKKQEPKKEVVWSRPTAILNTRIPPEADDLLDELLQVRRADWKKGGRIGNEPTKQSLILEAIILLLDGG